MSLKKFMYKNHPCSFCGRKYHMENVPEFVLTANYQVCSSDCAHSIDRSVLERENSVGWPEWLFRNEKVMTYGW